MSPDPSPSAPIVLLVEDEERVARTLGKILRQAGFDTAIAPSLATARAELARLARPGGAAISAVVLDLLLPDGHGTDLLGDLKASGLLASTAVLSVALDGDLTVELLERGVIAIPKPIGAGAFVAVVLRLVAAHAVGDPVARFCVAHALSARQTELLGMYCAGLGRRQCAARLGCSTEIVGTHLKRILRKTARGTLRELLAAGRRET
ncbi:MAG: response regulator [Deltaproteobacteria bacterium]|nr:response regulator [Deltaproteobacteria bacterium]